MHPKSASAYLGLGTPSRNPSVAPGTEDTGGNGWGGGFGDVDGFLQLVMKDGLANGGFVGVGKESADSRANSVSKIIGEKGVLKPFRYGSLGGSGSFVGALEYRAPSTVGD